MAAGVYRGPVKIVIINTQYVETDAMSFKSVVQKLTGKDSKIEMEPITATTATAPSSFSSSPPPSLSSGFSNKDDQPTSHNNNSNNVGPVMGRGLSFKDFDSLLKELPSLDELFGLCG